jgi:hypothetical protein
MICAPLSTAYRIPCAIEASDVEPDDIAHLVDQQRVRRQLEGLGAMRLLQSVSPRGVASTVRTITCSICASVNRDTRLCALAHLDAEAGDDLQQALPRQPQLPRGPRASAAGARQRQLDEPALELIACLREARR